MDFERIIGHTATGQQLRKMIETDRLPHAMLLIGPPGNGKLAIAWAVAKYVMCSHRSPEAACGTCADCRKVDKLVHPDLHFSYPTIKSQLSTALIKEWRAALTENPCLEIHQWLQIIGAENQQGKIYKDECVDIIRRLTLKPFENPWKVMIIWLPEYMDNEGNRLLKLIEEPPHQTLFILVGEQQEAILGTIRSRCQTVLVTPTEDEDLAKALQSEGIAEEAAWTMARLAEGNLNEAYAMARFPDQDRSSEFLEWMRLAYGGKSYKGWATWVDKSFAQWGREQQKYFFQYALYFLRSIVLIKSGMSDEALRMSSEELNTAKKMERVIDFGQVEALTAMINDAIVHIGRNANPKILGMQLTIQAYRIFSGKWQAASSLHQGIYAL